MRECTKGERAFNKIAGRSVAGAAADAESGARKAPHAEGRLPARTPRGPGDYQAAGGGDGRPLRRWPDAVRKRQDRFGLTAGGGAAIEKPTPPAETKLGPPRQVAGMR